MPGSLTTVTDPLCRRTSSCTNDKPMPVPSCVRPSLALDPMEALEDVRELVLGDAHAGVASRRARSTDHRCRSVTTILPSSVNLKALDSEVQDDLLPHVAIDVDAGSGSGWQSTTSSMPARFDRRAERAREICRERGEVGRLVTSRSMRPASMREKSRSVFTSLSRRRLLRCTSSTRSPFARRASGAFRQPGCPRRVRE